MMDASGEVLASHKEAARERDTLRHENLELRAALRNRSCHCSSHVPLESFQRVYDKCERCTVLGLPFGGKGTVKMSSGNR